MNDCDDCETVNSTIIGRDNNNVDVESDITDRAVVGLELDNQSTEHANAPMQRRQQQSASMSGACFATGGSASRASDNYGANSGAQSHQPIESTAKSIEEAEWQNRDGDQRQQRQKKRQRRQSESKRSAMQESREIATTIRASSRRTPAGMMDKEEAESEQSADDETTTTTTTTTTNELDNNTDTEPSEEEEEEEETNGCVVGQLVLNVDFAPPKAVVPVLANDDNNSSSAAVLFDGHQPAGGPLRPRATAAAAALSVAKMSHLIEVSLCIKQQERRNSKGGDKNNSRYLEEEEEEDDDDDDDNDNDNNNNNKFASGAAHWPSRGTTTTTANITTDIHSTCDNIQCRPARLLDDCCQRNGKEQMRRKRIVPADDASGQSEQVEVKSEAEAETEGSNKSGNKRRLVYERIDKFSLELVGRLCQANIARSMSGASSWLVFEKQNRPIFPFKSGTFDACFCFNLLNVRLASDRMLSVEQQHDELVRPTSDTHSSTHITASSESELEVEKNWLKMERLTTELRLSLLAELSRVVKSKGKIIVTVFAYECRQRSENSNTKCKQQETREQPQRHEKHEHKQPHQHKQSSSSNIYDKRTKSQHLSSKQDRAPTAANRGSSETEKPTTQAKEQRTGNYFVDENGTTSAWEQDVSNEDDSCCPRCRLEWIESHKRQEHLQRPPKYTEEPSYDRPTTIDNDRHHQQQQQKQPAHLATLHLNQQQQDVINNSNYRFVSTTNNDQNYDDSNQQVLFSRSLANGDLFSISMIKPQRDDSTTCDTIKQFIGRQTPQQQSAHQTTTTTGISNQPQDNTNNNNNHYPANSSNYKSDDPRIGSSYYYSASSTTSPPTRRYSSALWRAVSSAAGSGSMSDDLLAGTQFQFHRDSISEAAKRLGRRLSNTSTSLLGRLFTASSQQPPSHHHQQQQEEKEPTLSGSGSIESRPEQCDIRIEKQRSSSSSSSAANNNNNNSLDDLDDRRAKQIYLMTDVMNLFRDDEFAKRHRQSIAVQTFFTKSIEVNAEDEDEEEEEDNIMQVAGKEAATTRLQESHVNSEERGALSGRGGKHHHQQRQQCVKESFEAYEPTVADISQQRQQQSQSQEDDDYELTYDSTTSGWTAPTSITTGLESSLSAAAAATATTAVTSTKLSAHVTTKTPATTLMSQANITGPVDKSLSGATPTISPGIGQHQNWLLSQNSPATTDTSGGKFNQTNMDRSGIVAGISASAAADADTIQADDNNNKAKCDYDRSGGGIPLGAAHHQQRQTNDGLNVNRLILSDQESCLNNNNNNKRKQMPDNERANLNTLESSSSSGGYDQHKQGNSNRELDFIESHLAASGGGDLRASASGSQQQQQEPVVQVRDELHRINSDFSSFTLVTTTTDENNDTKNPTTSNYSPATNNTSTTTTNGNGMNVAKLGQDKRAHHQHHHHHHHHHRHHHQQQQQATLLKSSIGAAGPKAADHFLQQQLQQRRAFSETEAYSLGHHLVPQSSMLVETHHTSFDVNQISGAAKGTAAATSRGLPSNLIGCNPAQIGLLSAVQLGGSGRQIRSAEPIHYGGGGSTMLLAGSSITSSSNNNNNHHRNGAATTADLNRGGALHHHAHHHNKTLTSTTTSGATTGSSSSDHHSMSYLIGMNKHTAITGQHVYVPFTDRELLHQQPDTTVTATSSTTTGTATTATATTTTTATITTSASASQQPTRERFSGGALTGPYNQATIGQQQQSSVAKYQQQQWCQSTTFSSSLNSDISTSGGPKDTTEKDSSRRTSTLSGISSIYQQEISLGLATPHSYAGSCSTPANSQAAACSNMGSIPELAMVPDQLLQQQQPVTLPSSDMESGSVQRTTFKRIGGQDNSLARRMSQTGETTYNMRTTDNEVSTRHNQLGGRHQAAEEPDTVSHQDRGREREQQQQQQELPGTGSGSGGSAACHYQRQQQSGEFEPASASINLQRVAQSLKSQLRERLSTMRPLNAFMGLNVTVPISSPLDNNNNNTNNLTSTIQEEPPSPLLLAADNSSAFGVQEQQQESARVQQQQLKVGESQEFHSGGGVSQQYYYGLPIGGGGQTSPMASPRSPANATATQSGMTTTNRSSSKTETPTPVTLKSFFRSTSSAAFNAFASSFQHQSSSSTPTGITVIQRNQVFSSSQHSSQQFPSGSLSSDVFDPPGQSNTATGSPSLGASGAKFNLFGTQQQTPTASTSATVETHTKAAMTTPTQTTNDASFIQSTTNTPSPLLASTGLRSPLSPISVTSTRFFSRIRDKFSLSPTITTTTGTQQQQPRATSAMSTTTSTSTSVNASTIISQQQQQRLLKSRGQTSGTTTTPKSLADDGRVAQLSAFKEPFDDDDKPHGHAESSSAFRLSDTKDTTDVCAAVGNNNQHQQSSGGLFKETSVEVDTSSLNDVTLNSELTSTRKASGSSVDTNQHTTTTNTTTTTTTTNNNTTSTNDIVGVDSSTGSSSNNRDTTPKRPPPVFAMRRSSATTTSSTGSGGGGLSHHNNNNNKPLPPNLTDSYEDYDHVVSSRRPSFQRQLDEQVNQVYRMAVERKLQNSPVSDFEFMTSPHLPPFDLAGSSCLQADKKIIAPPLDTASTAVASNVHQPAPPTTTITSQQRFGSDLNSIIRPMSSILAASAGGPSGGSTPSNNLVSSYQQQPLHAGHHLADVRSIYMPAQYQYPFQYNTSQQQQQPPPQLAQSQRAIGSVYGDYHQQWIESSQQSIDSSSSARSLRSCWFSMPELYAMNCDSSSQSPSGALYANQPLVSAATGGANSATIMDELLGAITLKLQPDQQQQSQQQQQQQQQPPQEQQQPQQKQQPVDWPSNQLYKQVASDGQNWSLSDLNLTSDDIAAPNLVAPPPSTSAGIVGGQQRSVPTPPSVPALDAPSSTAAATVAVSHHQEHTSSRGPPQVVGAQPYSSSQVAQPAGGGGGGARRQTNADPPLLHQSQLGTGTDDKNQIELIKSSTLDDSVCVSMKSIDIPEGGQRQKQSSEENLLPTTNNDNFSRPTSQNSTISSTSCALSDLNSSELQEMRSPMSGQHQWTTTTTTTTTTTNNTTDSASSVSPVLNVSPLSTHTSGGALPPAQSSTGEGACLGAGTDKQASEISHIRSHQSIPHCLVTNNLIDAGDDQSTQVNSVGEGGDDKATNQTNGSTTTSGLDADHKHQQFLECSSAGAAAMAAKQRAMSLIPTTNSANTIHLPTSGSPEGVCGRTQTAANTNTLGGLLAPVGSAAGGGGGLRRRSAMGNMMASNHDIAPAAATLDLRLASRRNRVKLTDLHPITFINDREFLNSMSSLKKASDNKLNAIFNSPVGRRLSVNAETAQNSVFNQAKSGIKIGLTGYVYIDHRSNKASELNRAFRRPSLAPNFWRTLNNRRGTETSELGQQQTDFIGRDSNLGLLTPQGIKSRPRSASYTPTAPPVNSQVNIGTTTHTEPSGSYGTNSSISIYAAAPESSAKESKGSSAYKPLIGAPPGYNLERRRSTMAMLERLSESSIELESDETIPLKQSSTTTKQKRLLSEMVLPHTTAVHLASPVADSRRKSVSSLLKIGEDEELRPTAAAAVAPLAGNIKRCERTDRGSKIKRAMMGVVGQVEHSPAATESSSCTSTGGSRSASSSSSTSSSSSRSSSPAPQHQKQEGHLVDSSGGSSSSSSSSSSSDDGDIDKLIAQYPDVAAEGYSLVQSRQAEQRLLQQDQQQRREPLLLAGYSTGSSGTGGGKRWSLSSAADDPHRSRSASVHRYHHHLHQPISSTSMASNRDRVVKNDMILKQLLLATNAATLTSGLTKFGIERNANVAREMRRFSAINLYQRDDDVFVANSMKRPPTSQIQVLSTLPLLAGTLPVLPPTNSTTGGQSALSSASTVSSKQHPMLPPAPSSNKQLFNQLPVISGARSGVKSIITGNSGLNLPKNAATQSPSGQILRAGSVSGHTSAMVAEVDVEEQLNRLRQQEKRSMAFGYTSAGAANGGAKFSISDRAMSLTGPPTSTSTSSGWSSNRLGGGFERKTMSEDLANSCTIGDVIVPTNLTIPAILQPPESSEAQRQADMILAQHNREGERDRNSLQQEQMEQTTSQVDTSTQQQLTTSKVAAVSPGGSSPGGKSPPHSPQPPPTSPPGASSTSPSVASVGPLLIGGRSDPMTYSSGTKSCEPFTKQLDTIIEGRGLLLGAEQQADPSYATRLRRLSGNHSRRSSLVNNSQQQSDSGAAGEEWCRCDLSPTPRRSSSAAASGIDGVTTLSNEERLLRKHEKTTKQSPVIEGEVQQPAFNQQRPITPFVGATQHEPLTGSSSISSSSKFVLDTMKSIARRTLNNLTTQIGATQPKSGGEIFSPSPGGSTLGAVGKAGRQQRSSSMIVGNSSFASAWNGSAGGSLSPAQPTLPSQLLREKVRANRDQKGEVEGTSSTSSSITGSPDDSSLISLDDAENYRTKNKDNKMKHGRSLESSSSLSSSTSTISPGELEEAPRDKAGVESYKIRRPVMGNTAAAAGEEQEEDEEVEEPKVCYKCNKKIRIEEAVTYGGYYDEEDLEDNQDYENYEDEEKDDAGLESGGDGDDTAVVGVRDSGGLKQVGGERAVALVGGNAAAASSSIMTDTTGQRPQAKKIAISGKSRSSQTARGHHGRRQGSAARRSASMNSADPSDMSAGGSGSIAGASGGGGHINRRKNKWHIQRNLAPKLKRQRSFSANYAPEVPNPVMPPPRRFSAAPTLTCPHRNKSSSHSSSSTLHHTYSIDSSESMITVIPANRGQEFKRASRGSISHNSGGQGIDSSGSFYALPRSPLSPRSPSRCSPGLLTPNTSEPPTIGLEPPFSPATTNTTTCSSTGPTTIIQQINIKKSCGNGDNQASVAIINATTEEIGGKFPIRSSASNGADPHASYYNQLYLSTNEPRDSRSILSGDEENLSLAVENGTSYNSDRNKLDEFCLDGSELQTDGEEENQNFGYAYIPEYDPDLGQGPGYGDSIEPQPLSLHGYNPGLDSAPTFAPAPAPDPNVPVIRETINNFCSRHSRQELEFLVGRIGYLRISDCYFSERSSTLCMVIEVKENSEQIRNR